MKYQLAIAGVSIICLFVFVYQQINVVQTANSPFNTNSAAPYAASIAPNSISNSRSESTYAAQQYINAIVRRDRNQERQFLTRQAALQTRQFQPPFETTISRCEKYEMGDVQIVSNELAKIRVVYEIKDRAGRLTDDYSTVLLKKESNRWKVWGMIVNYPTRNNQLTINFEDIPGTVNQVLTLKQELQSIEEDRLLAQRQAERLQNQSNPRKTWNNQGRGPDSNQDLIAPPEMAREINGVICK